MEIVGHRAGRQVRQRRDLRHAETVQVGHRQALTLGRRRDRKRRARVLVVELEQAGGSTLPRCGGDTAGSVALGLVQAIQRLLARQAQQATANGAVSALRSSLSPEGQAGTVHDVGGVHAADGLGQRERRGPVALVDRRQCAALTVGQALQQRDLVDVDVSRRDRIATGDDARIGTVMRCRTRDRDPLVDE